MVGLEFTVRFHRNDCSIVRASSHRNIGRLDRTVISINFSTTGPELGAMQFPRKMRAWRDGQCHRVQCALISQTFCPNFQTAMRWETASKQHLPIEQCEELGQGYCRKPVTFAFHPHVANKPISLPNRIVRSRCAAKSSSPISAS